MMAAIAREYEKGRLLLIGTTDLDAEQANILNIGAIAASGHPDALDLIRRSLRASSAIPGAFQPVMIDVELDGKEYQELHVDGGAIAQMFLYLSG
jgi:predicted acylesterase/phospholipase RssA